MSRFRDETRSKNPPSRLTTPEGNSQLGSNCPNSMASENSEEEARLEEDLVRLCVAQHVLEPDAGLGFGGSGFCFLF